MSALDLPPVRNLADLFLAANLLKIGTPCWEGLEIGSGYSERGAQRWVELLGCVRTVLVQSSNQATSDYRR